jgi:hypothetical protein
MKPILFTMPRTGSSIIAKLLGNLAKQHYGYAPPLDEYFTIIPAYKAEFKEDDNNIIKYTAFDRVNSVWFDDAHKIKLDRLQMLKNNPYLYMIKIFPIDLIPEIEEYIKTFDIIYLERRNVLHQLVSFLNLCVTNKAEYKKSDKKVSNIIYYPKHADAFINDHYHPYCEFKKNNPSKFPVLYYEDFMSMGRNEKALINLLGLDINNYEPLKADTIITPYTSENLEDLIINKKDWNNDKPRIIDALYKT